jgi:hypothetical protein
MLSIGPQFLETVMKKGHILTNYVSEIREISQRIFSFRYTPCLYPKWVNCDGVECKNMLIKYH